ncbi:MAG: hypothetical protein GXP13_02705 [Gammaproteobacteria bacterium]|nr:hypothetical protein [Gammaproteobacteria bacterium]
MKNELTTVKAGLFLVMLTLLFGIGLGAGFGIAEDSVKSYISDGIKANPDVHNKKSFSKIWRYAQRSHFHATGIAAFSIGLILLIMASSLTRKLKSLSSLLVGLGGLYPLSWFAMYLLAPSIGYRAAHQHFMTELFTYVGVLGLLLGILILCANLFFDLFQEKGN